MNITIDSDLSSEQEHALLTSIQYFGSKLIPSSVRRDINLEIEVVRGAENLGLLSNEDMFDEHGEIDLLPDISRNFHMMLRHDENVAEIIKVAAHEMVHLKQHALNELSYVICPNPKFPIVPAWKGEPWFAKRGDRVEYDSPWEQEAYGMEHGLYFKFQRYWNRTHV